MDLTQSQAHCLAIPNIEECFVGSEFSDAESVLAETERSMSRDLAEAISLLEKKTGVA